MFDTILSLTLDTNTIIVYTFYLILLEFLLPILMVQIFDYQLGFALLSNLLSAVYLNVRIMFLDAIASVGLHNAHVCLLVSLFDDAIYVSKGGYFGHS